MRAILKVLCIAIAVVSLHLFVDADLKAQSFIQIVEENEAVKDASLNGKAEAVFVSGSDNLFIETSRPSLDTQRTPRKNNNGMWEYAVELQLQTQEGMALGRTFTITQSGSANKTTFKKGRFAADYRYYFRVDPVKNPIFLVDNTQPTDVHLKNGEAAIEINSIIDFEIIPDARLVCQIDSSSNQAGFFSKMLIVNMVELEKLRAEVQRHQMVYEDLNESLLDRAEHQKPVDDKEWDRLQVLQERAEESEALLGDVTFIRIKAKDSNELSIDISDLLVKQKRVYTIETAGGRLEEDKPHWMLLANYALANVGQHSLGLTVGWAGRFGAYVSVMTNGSFALRTDLSVQMENQYDYLWNSDISKTRLAVTAGGLFAVKKLGYVYAGAGYGLRNLTWHTMSGQSAGMHPGTYKGVALEAGMFFNIGEHFLVSAGGLAQFPGPYFEGKVGVGYKF